MKKYLTRSVAFAASLVIGSAGVGCGGDDTSPGGAGASGGSGGSGGTGGSAGKAGSAGTAGTAGTGGSAGNGGNAGSGGQAGGTTDGGSPDTGGSMTVTCGTKTCSSDTSTGMTLAACCAQGEMNACGLQYQGICFTTTPGTSSPLCPDVPLQTTTGTTVNVPGCCTVTSVCGGNLGAPLGCNELTPFTGQRGAACGADAGPPPPPPPEGGSDSGVTIDGSTDGGNKGDSSQGDAPSDVRPADARTDTAG